MPGDRVLACVLLVLAAGAPAACSLDWTVRPEPGDAGAGDAAPDAPSRDSGADAPADAPAEGG